MAMGDILRDRWIPGDLIRENSYEWLNFNISPSGRR